MNWLDWAIVTIIVVSGWQGLQKGLISSISKVAGIIAGLALAYAGYKPLAIYFDVQWGWRDAISIFLIDRVPLPVIEQFNQKLVLFKILIDPFHKQSESISAYSMNDSIMNLANQLAISLLNFFSFVLLLFIGAFVVASLLRMFSGVLTHTILKPVDRLGGFAIGLARGMLIILIITIIAQPFISFSLAGGNKEMDFISKGISRSILLPYASGLVKGLDLPIPTAPLNNAHKET